MQKSAQRWRGNACMTRSHLLRGPAEDMPFRFSDRRGITHDLWLFFRFLERVRMKGSEDAHNCTRGSVCMTCDCCWPLPAHVQRCSSGLCVGLCATRRAALTAGPRPLLLVVPCAGLPKQVPMPESASTHRTCRIPARSPHPARARLLAPLCTLLTRSTFPGRVMSGGAAGDWGPRPCRPPVWARKR